MYESSSQDWQHESDTRYQCPPIMPPCGKIAKGPGTRRSENTERHGKQTRLERSEAKVVDNNASKIDKTAIWNVDEDVEDENDPDFDVQQGLPYLVPLPDLVGDAGAIGCKTFRRMVLLLVCQEAGVHRAIWQREPDED